MAFMGQSLGRSGKHFYMKRKTVVLVCMVDSIHVARWISQFEPSEVKFILFPSGPNRRVHPKINEMISRGKKFDNQLSVVSLSGRLSLVLWVLDRLASEWIRGLLLRRLLKRTMPDFVHALELQHAGYITLRALDDARVRTPFIATNYGSDIYWFSQYPKHKKKIESLLLRADFYSAECQRDFLLAREYGFLGRELPLMPNAGGIDPDDYEEGVSLASTRRIIAVKGYHGWVGRALTALEALESIAESLVGYKVVIYSANAAVIRRARFLASKTKIQVEVLGRVPHESMLSLFSKSRIYVGLSLSDGISTSLIEAMAMGAFPIQTSSSCADEWVFDGKTGFLVNRIDVKLVGEAIKLALEDDNLVDSAQIINRQTVIEKADPQKISRDARVFYQLGL
jgi:glycosyltransferase involved in cell wall biosynthesis